MVNIEKQRTEEIGLVAHNPKKMAGSPWCTGFAILHRSLWTGHYDVVIISTMAIRITSLTIVYLTVTGLCVTGGRWIPRTNGQ